LKEEETQPSELPFQFKDELFEDYGNTSSCSRKRKSSVPVPPDDPMEASFRKENVKQLTAIMTNEWLRELELSLEVLRSAPLPQPFLVP